MATEISGWNLAISDPGGMGDGKSMRRKPIAVILVSHDPICLQPVSPVRDLCVADLAVEAVLAQADAHEIPVAVCMLLPHSWHSRLAEDRVEMRTLSTAGAQHELTPEFLESILSTSEDFLQSQEKSGTKLVVIHRLDWGVPEIVNPVWLAVHEREGARLSLGTQEDRAVQAVLSLPCQPRSRQASFAIPLAVRTPPVPVPWKSATQDRLQQDLHEHYCGCLEAAGISTHHMAACEISAWYAPLPQELWRRAKHVPRLPRPRTLLAPETPVQPERPLIVEYDSHRSVISAFYEYRKSKNRAFSFRRMAQLAEIRSPGFFQDVILGRRHLAPAQIAGTVRALGLDAAEADYFGHLVEGGETGSAHRMGELRARFLQKILPPEQGSSLSAWYIPVVQLITRIPGFPLAPDNVVAFLEGTISRQQAEHALRVLQTARLLEEGGERPQLLWYDTTNDKEVHPIHLDTLAMWQSRLRQLSRSEVVTSLINMTVPQERVDMLMERLKAMSREIMGLGCDVPCGSAPRLVQVGIYLVPVGGRHDGSEE